MHFSYDAILINTINWDAVVAITNILIVLVTAILGMLSYRLSLLSVKSISYIKYTKYQYGNNYLNKFILINKSTVPIVIQEFGVYECKHKFFHKQSLNTIIAQSDNKKRVVKHDSTFEISYTNKELFKMIDSLKSDKYNNKNEIKLVYRAEDTHGKHYIKKFKIHRN